MKVRFFFGGFRYCVGFHGLDFFWWTELHLLLASEFHRFSLWYQLWTCRATCKHALGTQERWNKSIFPSFVNWLLNWLLVFWVFFGRDFDAPVWLWAYIASPGPLSWVKMRTVVANSDWDGEGSVTNMNRQLGEHVQVHLFIYTHIHLCSTRVVL